MLVKILNMSDDLVHQLKLATGCATAAGATHVAAESYLTCRHALAESEQEVRDLRQRLDVALQVIEGARSAASLLVEVTGQSDLFAR